MVFFLQHNKNFRMRRSEVTSGRSRWRFIMQDGAVLDGAPGGTSIKNKVMCLSLEILQHKAQQLMMSLGQTETRVFFNAVRRSHIQEVAPWSATSLVLGRHGVAAAAAVSPWQQAALGGDGPAVGVAPCFDDRHFQLRAVVRLFVQQPLHLLSEKKKKIRTSSRRGFEESN